MHEFTFSTIIRTLTIQAEDLIEAEKVYQEFWESSNERHPQVIEDSDEVLHLVQDSQGVLIG